MKINFLNICTQKPGCWIWLAYTKNNIIIWSVVVITFLTMHDENQFPLQCTLKLNQYKSKSKSKTYWEKINPRKLCLPTIKVRGKIIIDLNL